MLPITEYPSFVKEMKHYLESAFSNWRQMDNVMRYRTGLIVPPERKNVSQISGSFVTCKNQSSVNNFITDSAWSDSEFHSLSIQVVKDQVEKQKIKHGKLVIDDTLSEKSGKQIKGAGWFYDISQNKDILSHNIISSHYIAGTFHVTLVFEVYVKKEDCPDKSKFKTKIEIAKDLLKKAVSYNIDEYCCSPKRSI